MRVKRLTSATAVAAALLFCVCSFAAECPFTQAQLQDESLAILRKDYPDREFSAGETPDLIHMGKGQLGLDNLYAKLCGSQQPLDAAARAEGIRTHFAAMMKLIRQQEAQPPLAWADARKLVRPQLQTEEYFHSLAQGKDFFVTKSFIPGVVLTAVIDQPDGYQYVRKDELERWQITRDVLFEEGLRNLTEQTMADAGLQGANGADKFMFSEEGDGYDAVRILVPWVREEAAKLLGEPFLAAIANRDFLIMWSAANSAEFQQKFRGIVAQDFKERPYALSSRVLRVWADGRIELE